MVVRWTDAARYSESIRSADVNIVRLQSGSGFVALQQRSVAFVRGWQWVPALTRIRASVIDNEYTVEPGRIEPLGGGRGAPDRISYFVCIFGFNWDLFDCSHRN